MKPGLFAALVTSPFLACGLSFGLLRIAIHVIIDLEYPRAGFIRVAGCEDAVIAFSSVR